MIGICAGLALKGCQPFAYTIATFSLYRPFEMVRDDLCYQNLPGHGGRHGRRRHLLRRSAARTTRRRTSPSPARSPTCRSSRHAIPPSAPRRRGYCATQKKGPVYLRIGKAGEPKFTDKAVDPWVFGKLRYIKRGS